MDVLRKVKSQGADSVSTVGRVNVRHVVNSRELTVDASAKVEEVEILVNSDRAPMRNVDVSRGFSERWQWVWESEEELDLLESGRGDIGVRTVHQTY